MNAKITGSDDKDGRISLWLMCSTWLWLTLLSRSLNLIGRKIISEQSRCEQMPPVVICKGWFYKTNCMFIAAEIFITWHVLEGQMMQKHFTNLSKGCHSKSTPSTGLKHHCVWMVVGVLTFFISLNFGLINIKIWVLSLLGGWGSLLSLDDWGRREGCIGNAFFSFLRGSLQEHLLWHFPMLICIFQCKYDFLRQ